MSTIWQVPLSPRNQQLVLDIGGTSYTLHFNYNVVNQTWIVDVADANDNPICNGISLVTGVDLFGQFRYLGIGGGVPMITMTMGVGHSPDEIPTFDNLGIEAQVFFQTLV
jgi:hypothetical protein